MIAGAQWNAKAVIGATVAGIVILYTGYTMHKMKEAPVGEPADVKLNVRQLARFSAGQVLQFSTGQGRGGGAGHEKQPGITKLLVGDLLLHTAMPADLKDSTKNKGVKIEEKTIKVAIDKDERTIFYREVPSSSGKLPLLLLHGMAFTSQNWVDIKTMQTAARMGHRVVAVDLPGFGKTGGSRDVTNKGQFIDDFIRELKLDHPIIVSPSMSGTFSLPFIMGDFSHKAGGFIPVAPGSTQRYDAAEYKKVNIPVIILYGSKDERMGVPSAERLQNFPNSKVHIVHDAGHPAYIEKPAEWHRVLYNFLQMFDKK